MRACRWFCAAALWCAACSSEVQSVQGGSAVGGSASSRPGSGAPPGRPGSKSNTGSSPDVCPEGVARAERVTPRVVLLLDGSCSMSTDYPANGARSASDCTENARGRWTALRNALVDPQHGVVTRLQGAVEFGLAVFGTRPMCPIPTTPIQPALNNLAAISGAIAGVQPGQFTPTGPALSWVYANMLRPTGAPDAKDGPQIVVLATDGEPNACDSAEPNYQPSIDAVTSSQSLGVQTYVVSLADATGTFHDHLQQLADLGAGRSGAQLFEPNTPEELAASLELLIGGAVGCDVALNGTVEEANACTGTVTLNGREVSCKDPNGWVLADPRHVRLQGASCEELKRTQSATVAAKFPCGVFQPI